MALTLSNIEKDVWGKQDIRTFDVAFDGSYPTGGELLTAADLGMCSITHLAATTKSGFVFEYDYSGSKLKALYPTANQGVAASAANQPDVTGGAATASAVDSTTPTVTIPAGFRSEVDHSIGEEVEDTANLSALTAVKVFVIGT